MTVPSRESQKIWRVIDLINWGEQYFSENNFENPRKEIEILLQDILECSRVDLYIRFEEPLNTNQLAKLRGWVQRRKIREPIQYITGKTGFYNLIINVTPNVLIPRPESEHLVDEVIANVDKNSNISILDIGTGSGCLALALAHELQNARVAGIDNSIKTVELAKLNALNLKIENVEFSHFDFLVDNLHEEYDIIISNPPYIPAEEIDALMPDVKDFEPHTALTDSSDGLIFYRRIAEIGIEILKSNGWIFLEVGIGKHPHSAMQLFINKNFKNVELIKDYNGDDRILKAQVA